MLMFYLSICFFVVSVLFSLPFAFPSNTHTHTHISQAIQEDVSSREAEVDRLESLSQSLTPLSCTADRDWLSERVGAVRSGHSELADWCTRRAGLLEQALANAQLFGEEEVEVLNWLAEVAQRLTQVSVQSYQPQLLAEHHKHTLVRLHEHTESELWYSLQNIRTVDRTRIREMTAVYMYNCNNIL